jgi:hypothetical protein
LSVERGAAYRCGVVMSAVGPVPEQLAVLEAAARCAEPVKRHCVRAAPELDCGDAAVIAAAPHLIARMRPFAPLRQLNGWMGCCCSMPSKPAV